MSFSWVSKSQNVWGWQRPLGPSGPTPAQAGIPRGGCPWPCPGGFQSLQGYLTASPGNFVPALLVSTKTLRPVFAELFSSSWLLLPSCRTLHFLLNCMRFLSAHHSILSRSLRMAVWWVSQCPHFRVIHEFTEGAFYPTVQTINGEQYWIQ